MRQRSCNNGKRADRGHGGRNRRWCLALAAALLAGVLPVAGAPHRGVVLHHPWAEAHPVLRRLAAEFSRSEKIPVDVLFRPEGADPQPGPARMPDIIGLPSCGADASTVARMARAGRLQELGEWADETWRAQFVPAAFRPFMVPPGNCWNADPGIYGVPLSLEIRLFVYRPDLLDLAGPAQGPGEWHWSDFLAAARRLKALGVEPLVGALAPCERPALSRMYEASYVGEAALRRTYRGEECYTSEPWRALFGLYAGLRKAGMFRGPLAFCEQGEARSAFLRGRAGLLVDGPRFVGVQETEFPGLAQWDVFPPPWGDEGARFMPAVPAEAGESLVVNPRSIRRGSAVRFLRWLTGEGPQVAYANATSSLPASLPAMRSPRLRPGLQRFARHAAHAAPGPCVSEDPEVSRVYYESVVAVLQGRAEPEAALARIDRAKQLRRPTGKQ